MKLKQYRALKSNEIHIWLASFPEVEKDITYFTALLSEDEYERANSYKFSKDKKHFIISRGILRSLLGGYLREDAKNVKIMYGLWGKPTLPAKNSVHFNLSHSKDYVLYAITRKYEVGIDLEYIDKNFCIEKEMLNIFSTAWLNDWDKLNAEDKTSAFFKGWVSKEAFLKAYGKGWLGYKNETPLGKTHILTKKSEEKSSSTLIPPCCFDLVPGYASALFVMGPSLRLVHYTWNNNLINLI